MRTHARTVLASLTTVVLVGSLLTTWSEGVAGAATTGKGAYVWANQPTSSSYIPTGAYADDSAGGTITIARSGTGAYKVRFPNLGPVGGTGTVNVTAYGSTPATCRTGGWTVSGSAVLVTVDCYSLAGSLVDSYFTASFSSDTAESPTLDYVWSNNPAPGIGTTYTPASSFRFDSAGHAVTVTQIATGAYDVNLPGPVTVGGSVKVSTYNNPAINCQVVDWITESPGQVAEVDCFDASGALADSAFDLTFLAANNVLGVANLFSGYVWANNASAASYTPAKPYQYNSAKKVDTASRSTVGVYTVTLPGLGRSVATGDVQVTAYGSTDDFCQVGSWSSSGSKMLAIVRCFTPADSAADSEFTLQYVSRL